MRTKLLPLFLLVFTWIFIGSVSAQTDTNKDNRVYMIVPQMPTFPGNVDDYIAAHIQYPKAAKDKGLKGTVNVTFVITQTGTITNINILSGIFPELDSEAVRIVRTMPQWNPGIKDGKPVKVQYNLPIYIGPPGAQGESTVADIPKKPKDSTRISREGLYIDPYTGIGIGGPPFTSTNISISRGLNMKFGVALTKIFSSNIGVSVGLQMQQYNFSYSFSNFNSANSYNGLVTSYRSVSNDTAVTAGYNGNVKYSIMYVQLPLLLRCITSQENKPGFFIEAGVVLNYFLSGTITGNVTQTQYQLNQAPNTYWYMYSSTLAANPTPISATPQNPANFTAAFHASFGVLIPFTTKMSLILGASPDIGLMNAGNGSNDSMNFGNSKFYIFGNGNYGSFTTWLFDAKFLIKLSRTSKVIHLN